MSGRRMLGWAIFAAGLAPAAWIAWLVATGALGANPIERLEHETGLAGLRLLLATLAVTPLRRLGFRAIAPFRRRLGLLAFAYAVAHFSIWAVLDTGLDPRVLVDDVVERPFVTVGFAAFLLLVPLAATSTRASVRRLGKRWIALHRLIYPAAALVVLHYFWLVKKDLASPLRYAAVLAVLLAIRLWPRLRALAVRPVVG